ncbi:MAG: N-acyl homoserine lactonase family protein [Acidimicrobiales bacterium]
MNDVFALHLGTKPTTSSVGFYFDHAAEPMELAYYCWLIRASSRTVLVDTGPRPEVAERRGVELGRPIEELLADLGVAPGDVDDVVVTHLHWDHVGNLALFDRAKVWVQRRELDFWQSSASAELAFAAAIERSHLDQLEMVGDRLTVVDDVAEVIDGIELRHTGGHTHGCQIVTVQTGDGTVVLASDIAYFAANVETVWPTLVFHDLAETYAALRLVGDLASHPSLVVPGHDPATLTNHERITDDIARITRLDDTA